MKLDGNNIWRLSWFYIGGTRLIFFIGILCGIIYGIMSGLGIPVIFEKVFRKIFESDGGSYGIWQIILVAILVPISFLIRGIFGFFNTYLMNVCGVEILKNIRADIFAKLQRLPLLFFDKKTSGDLINRVVGDPRALQEVILEIASEFFKQPLQMLAAFIGLIYLSIKANDAIFLVIFVFAMPICFIPVRLLRTNVKGNSRKMQKAESDMTECVAENLRAAQEVRTFGLEKRMYDKALDTMQNLASKIIAVVKLQKMQQPMMEFVSAIIISVIFSYAYFKKIPFSIFSSMGMALYFAFDPIKKISNTISQIHRVSGALERITEILNMPEEIENCAKPQKPQKIFGSFALENVSFYYDSSKNEKPALLNVNLKIEAGQFCAIVGPSGSGKSTLAKLLPRLYDVSAGEILIDGINIKNIDIATLRKNISIVSQHPVLLNDTVFNNIALGKQNSTQEEVFNAAKLAYADDFIKKLEHGYNSIIGENGGLLSGGQRQRIAIARAFLKNAPVLILDEATSALDSESESLIRDAITTLSSNKTVIAIAHRISTILKADNIFILNNGALISNGSHNQLLLQCPLYNQLVTKQLL